jgi:geranylgeranyl diphosphate synthase type II
MSAKEFLAQKARKTEAALEDYVSSWYNATPLLVEAVRYSLFAKGKRLRPALALGAAELVSGDDAVALPAACALEMIHTYSLIHDDLPAMDDDDLRRGLLTLHKVYGEAMAILAGDALLTMAFDLLAETQFPEVIREVARAAGVAGMVGGQVLDLKSEGEPIGLEQLRAMHEQKTGALIRVSVRAGAILGSASEEQLEWLTRYAEHLGLAFQIADDILDATGDADAMGKNTGSDAAKGKATYVSILGLDESGRRLRETVEDAAGALEPLGDGAASFRALAFYVAERKN